MEETPTSIIAGITITTEISNTALREDSSTSDCRSDLLLDIKRYTVKVNLLLENWLTRGTA